MILVDTKNEIITIIELIIKLKIVFLNFKIESPSNQVIVNSLLVDSLSITSGTCIKLHLEKIFLKI